MERNLRHANGKYLYRVLCILAVVSALLPLACDYIMNGGIVAEWIDRVETLNGESMHLFPLMGVDSNLWLFLPALLHRVSGNMVLTYRVYMLLIQIGTFFFAKSFFETFFSQSGTKLPAYFGILMYMTCPYRIYVSYDLADFSETIVWMLLPLYAWAICRIGQMKWSWKEVVAVSLSLAGVGYAAPIYFVILSGLTVLVMLCCKKWTLIVTVLAGAILFAPGLYRLAQYLTSDTGQEFGITVQTIMQNGYRVGAFFTTYTFRDSHPGMGMGMMFCLLLHLWLRFVNGNVKWSGGERLFCALAIFLIVLSLQYFPWDFVQRVGIWLLRLVSLMNTPAILGGLGFGCLCVPAAAAVGRAAEEENKLLSIVVPLFVLIVCVGVCFYQCNMLTYSRLPIKVL